MKFFLLLLNYLLRGCVFGLSGPARALVSQIVGGGGMAPLAPTVPTPMDFGLLMAVVVQLVEK